MRRKLCIAALLLALCCPALAGEIPNPPVPHPGGITTPGPPTGDEPSTEDEELDTPAVPDGLAERFLDLLAFLPTLL